MLDAEQPDDDPDDKLPVWRVQVHVRDQLGRDFAVTEYVQDDRADDNFAAAELAQTRLVAARRLFIVEVLDVARGVFVPETPDEQLRHAVVKVFGEGDR